MLYWPTVLCVADMDPQPSFVDHRGHLLRECPPPFALPLVTHATNGGMDKVAMVQLAFGIYAGAKAEMIGDFSKRASLNLSLPLHHSH